MTYVDEEAEVQLTRIPVGVAPSQIETVSTTSSSFRWVVWCGFALVTAAILVAGYIGWWYVGKFYPEPIAAAQVEFTVTEDDTVESVSQRLYDDELISDPELFGWYVERQGGLELIPGYYEIQSGVHMGDVLERLRTPPGQTYHPVTFPEGFTVNQMADRLEDEDSRLDADSFRAVATDGTVTSKYLPPEQLSLEGLLFPDTYQVSNADNEGQVVERMVGLMERVAAQEELEAGAERLGLTPYQVLTVASLIEREAKVDEDRAKIARVIYNRLAIDMNLQIDAAVLYGAPGYEGSFADLRQIDTPYNNYMHKGLPPTPIANPGRASIRAALNPADNPTDRDAICKAIGQDQECVYLFYVLADADGSHVFAATPEQHEANVAAANAKGLL